MQLNILKQRREYLLVNLLAAYQCLDRFRSKSLSKQQFVHFLWYIHNHARWLKAPDGDDSQFMEEVELRFSAIDVDRSGTVDKKEFSELCQALLLSVKDNEGSSRHHRVFKRYHWTWHWYYWYCHWKLIFRWVLRNFFRKERTAGTIVWTQHPGFATFVRITVILHLVSNALYGGFLFYIYRG